MKLDIDLSHLNASFDDDVVNMDRHKAPRSLQASIPLLATPPVHEPYTEKLDLPQDARVRIELLRDRMGYETRITISRSIPVSASPDMEQGNEE